MAIPMDTSALFSFSAVLIDFNNSSIKREAYCPTEKDKIGKNVRLFKIRLGPYILMDWEWQPETKPIIEQYDLIRDIRIGFDAVVRMVEIIKSHSFTEKNILEILNKLASYAMNQFSMKPVIDSLTEMSKKEGYEKEFNEYLTLYKERLSSTENMEYEITVIEDGYIKAELYKSFFG